MLRRRASWCGGAKHGYAGRPEDTTASLLRHVKHILQSTHVGFEALVGVPLSVAGEHCGQVIDRPHAMLAHNVEQLLLVAHVHAYDGLGHRCWRLRPVDACDHRAHRVAPSH